MSILTLAFTATEAKLVRRAVVELIDREGDSSTAVSVLEMLRRPLRVEDLNELREETRREPQP